MEAHTNVPHSLEFKSFLGVKITQAAEQAVDFRIGRISADTIDMLLLVLFHGHLSCTK